MASQLWHAAPAHLPSKPHSCSLTWNGGERTITSCAPMHHFEWRSCSRESVEASWWRNAIGNERQRWQPGEPIDDGRRTRCSLTPCRRFLLERHASQARLQCHGVAGGGEGPSAESG